MILKSAFFELGRIKIVEIAQNLRFEISLLHQYFLFKYFVFEKIIYSYIRTSKLYFVIVESFKSYSGIAGCLSDSSIHQDKFHEYILKHFYTHEFLKCFSE